jgi:hypothetical protein
VRAARTAALIGLPASAWAVLAQGVAQLRLGSAAAFIGLTAGAAFGIGYEIGDGGTAAALFIVVAAVGLVVIGTALLSGQLAASSGALFGVLPALVAAPSAHAGGALRERRLQTPITGKEVAGT